MSLAYSGYSSVPPTASGFFTKVSGRDFTKRLLFHDVATRRIYICSTTALRALRPLFYFEIFVPGRNDNPTPCPSSKLSSPILSTRNTAPSGMEMPRPRPTITQNFSPYWDILLPGGALYYMAPPGRRMSRPRPWPTAPSMGQCTTSQRPTVTATPTLPPGPIERQRRPLERKFDSCCREFGWTSL